MNSFLDIKEEEGRYAGKVCTSLRSFLDNRGVGGCTRPISSSFIKGRGKVLRGWCALP